MVSLWVMVRDTIIVPLHLLKEKNAAFNLITALMHHMASTPSDPNQTHPQCHVTNRCMLGQAKMLMLDPPALHSLRNVLPLVRCEQPLYCLIILVVTAKHSFNSKCLKTIWGTHLDTRVEWTDYALRMLFRQMSTTSNSLTVTLSRGECQQPLCCGCKNCAGSICGLQQLWSLYCLPLCVFYLSDSLFCCWFYKSLSSFLVNCSKAALRKVAVHLELMI